MRALFGRRKKEKEREKLDSNVRDYHSALLRAEVQSSAGVGAAASPSLGHGKTASLGRFSTPPMRSTGFEEAVIATPKSTRTIPRSPPMPGSPPSLRSRVSTSNLSTTREIRSHFDPETLPLPSSPSLSLRDSGFVEQQPAQTKRASTIKSFASHHSAKTVDPSPRIAKQADASSEPIATNNIGQRLSELAVAHQDGLIDDEEYRTLRTALFVKFDADTRSRRQADEEARQPRLFGNPLPDELRDPQTRANGELQSEKSLKSAQTNKTGRTVGSYLRRRVSSIKSRASHGLGIINGDVETDNEDDVRSASSMQRQSSSSSRISMPKRTSVRALRGQTSLDEIAEASPHEPMRIRTLPKDSMRPGLNSMAESDSLPLASDGPRIPNGHANAQQTPGASLLRSTSIYRRGQSSRTMIDSVLSEHEATPAELRREIDDLKNEMNRLTALSDGDFAKRYQERIEYLEARIQASSIKKALRR
ncbi:uncharacterized protein L969DRAFT_14937 [Mixia osmundae IAM 14324]|nr:uncharacterized protein L969DRAFT_14937 [Mixia osmundae IAM 14324]KEI42736.1 hypothetical protein L969DRAFT_14937 [Mixia osmundae IAM 14324]